MYFFLASIFGSIALVTAKDHYWWAVALLFIALSLAEKSGKREAEDV
jgi:hypothetical protein